MLRMLLYGYLSGGLSSSPHCFQQIYIKDKLYYHVLSQLVGIWLKPHLHALNPQATVSPLSPSYPTLWKGSLITAHTQWMLHLLEREHLPKLLSPMFENIISS